MHTTTQPDPTTAPLTMLERVKAMVRRDLKLGNQPLDDDTRLIGGDLDVDSLDVLLLVVSIEKEFGVKIANPAIAKQAFSSPKALVEFIKSSAAGSTAAQAAAPALSLDQLLERLPHQPPFRFVTKLTKISGGVDGEGTWLVRGDEAFLAGHFPGNPIVPGVLISEALAQLSGVIASATGVAARGQLVHVDVRFLAPVKPPAEITLSSRVTRSGGALHQFEVKAAVGPTIVASGSITLHLG